MNDLKLLQEAYKAVYENKKEPLYIGSEKDKQWAMKWLETVDYEVHEDGSITVNEEVDLWSIGLTKLPFNFKEVKGDFSCSSNKITSLQGAPQNTEGNFDCSASYLVSLEGAPQTVGGDFACYGNELTSLKGAPKKVGGIFDCSVNEIATLEGAPEFVGGEFICDQFSDKEYRNYIKNEKYVKGKLEKDFDIDLQDF
jgi:hypothetical protein